MIQLCNKRFSQTTCSLAALMGACLAVSTGAHAANIDTVQTGNWTTGATWSSGSQPAPGDSTFLKVGTTTVDSSVTINSVRVENAGTLELASGGTLNASSLRFGWFGAGTLVRSGGNINVTGFVDVEDGSTFTAGPGDQAGSFRIGNTETLITPAGSTLTVSGELRTGWFGAPTIDRSGGGTITAGTLTISDNAVFISAPGDVLTSGINFTNSSGGSITSAPSTETGIGLTLDGPTINFHDSDDVIELSFTDPTTFAGGNYWAFRWLGSHTSTINDFINVSNRITIDTAGFNTVEFGTPVVFEDGGYTYVGIENLTIIPEPASLALLGLGGLLVGTRQRRDA